MPVALARAVEALEAIAPLRLAEDWDNVGLLVEPARARRVKRALLAIDLTETVLEEAIGARCELVVAYHPPIFEPLRRLTNADAKLVLQAAAQRIALYSPHTALDAVEGGVNDWLADGLGPGARRSIRSEATGAGLRIVASLPRPRATALATELASAGAQVRVESTDDDVATVIASDAGQDALRALDAALDDLPPEWSLRSSVTRLEPRLRSRSGQGRLVELTPAASLFDLIERIKRHLGLSRVRVAAPRAELDEIDIRTVALCAGAGGSVVADQPADLYWTGEMRHHDVLAALGRRTSVVLCDHTNTERGYLPGFAERLRRELGDDVEVMVSEADTEPLRIV